MQTLNIPVDDAVLMQDVDGCSDLFTVESDDVFLQPQSGHLLQSPLVAVFHEDVHLLLEKNTPEILDRRYWTIIPWCQWMAENTSYPVEFHSKVSHQVGVFNAFKNLQLICSLLNGFVIVWLESDLVDSEKNVRAHL